MGFQLFIHSQDVDNNSADVILAGKDLVICAK